MGTVYIIVTNYHLKRDKNCCPEGMQFFLARVEQGKDTICEYLRRSAVNELNFRRIARGKDLFV
jgi:hypothetical protein